MDNAQVARIRRDWERMCEVNQWPRPWEEYLRLAQEAVIEARAQRAAWNAMHGPNRNPLTK